MFFVTFFHQLVGSINALKVVELEKLLDDKPSKEPTSSPGVLLPGFDFLWVRPHEIAEWSTRGNFHISLDRPHQVDSADLRGKTSMHTEQAT